MTNKELFYFIGKCLTLEEHPEFRMEIIDKAKSNLIDWDQFVILCNNHLVLPVIYSKFCSHRIIDHIPNELAEHLAEIFHLSVKRNEQILKQLRDITSILNEHDIHPIFLKGAGNLLEGLYDSIGDRILGDIDFLVAEKDYLPTAELMEKSGYTEIDDQYSHTDNVSSFKHYPRLVHPNYIATIEIHRIPTDEIYQSWFNNEIIEKDKKKISSIPGHSYVLADAHKIILNFIHSQLADQGFLHGWISLRDIYDLYLLSKKFPLFDTLAGIKTEQKAIAYYTLSSIILGLEDKSCRRKNWAFYVLYFRNSLNLKSAYFYSFNRSSIFILQRIFQGYLRHLFMSIYSKKERQYLKRRLFNRGWYADHIRLYTRFFKR